MSSIRDTLRNQIINWTVRFPLDNSFRKKYNISFGSEQHRALNEIDIYLDWLEQEVQLEFLNKAKESIENERLYSEGTWLKQSTVIEDDDEEMLDLWNKISTKDINSQTSQDVNDE
jgi:LPS O-antigen subunit length determinant protein (WzzB/FepE family)